MSNVIQLFCFNGLEVRSIVLENGDVWFVGRDVAQILEYVDKTDAVRQHCRRAKSLNSFKAFISESDLVNFGLNWKMLLIPESDLYHLVFTATSDVAIKLQDGLLDAVINTDFSEIPEIRKYSDFRGNIPLKIESIKLYVVLFSTGVIKVGKGKNAFKRVKAHIIEAARFGVEVTNFFIEEKPQITEEDLIKFCLQHGTLCNGNEYFKDLKFESVVKFVKQKVERKVLKLVR